MKAYLVGFLTGTVLFWTVAALLPPFWVWVATAIMLGIALLGILMCDIGIKICDTKMRQLSAKKDR